MAAKAGATLSTRPSWVGVMVRVRVRVMRHLEHAALADGDRARCTTRGLEDTRSVSMATIGQVVGLETQRGYRIGSSGRR